MTEKGYLWVRDLTKGEETFRREGGRPNLLSEGRKEGEEEEEEGEEKEEEEEEEEEEEREEEENELTLLSDAGISPLCFRVKGDKGKRESKEEEGLTFLLWGPREVHCC